MFSPRRLANRDEEVEFCVIMDAEDISEEERVNVMDGWADKGLIFVPGGKVVVVG